jgi:hypothetical protein
VVVEGSVDGLELESVVMCRSAQVEEEGIKAAKAEPV